MFVQENGNSNILRMLRIFGGSKEDVIVTFFTMSVINIPKISIFKWQCFIIVTIYIHKVFFNILNTVKVWPKDSSKCFFIMFSCILFKWYLKWQIISLETVELRIYIKLSFFQPNIYSKKCIFLAHLVFMVFCWRFQKTFPLKLCAYWNQTWPKLFFGLTNEFDDSTCQSTFPYKDTCDGRYCP